MAYETILTEKRGDVLVITLNRPERLNAASIQMAEELGLALYNLDGARCILITGAGRAFCSGADLQARGAGSAVSGGDASHRALMNYYNPVVSQILRAPVPVVTAVNGPAAGVGGSTWLLARTIGKARATQMMMLGERIGASQAEEWGLIYKACEDEALLGEAQALAERLAAGPTISYATMKRTIATALDGTLPEVLVAEAEGQRIAGGSDDAREGGMAFLEKRKPAFKGR